MKTFLAKISDATIVDKILNKQSFTHEGIYNFKDDLKIDSTVFLVFGGDKTQVSWVPGFIGYGKVTKAPYDEGYNNSRYFKIDITPEFVLNSPIPTKKTKIHPQYAEAIYEISYIGANHPKTQAIAETDLSGRNLLFTILAEEAYDGDNNVSIVDTNIDNLTTLETFNTESHSDFKRAGLCVTSDLLLRISASLLAKRFLILTGLSGSGKTKIAHAFASWLTSKKISQDAFSPGAKIQSDRIVYFVKDSDSLSVLFSNSEDGVNETLVLLPRALIVEWSNYIVENKFTRENTAREIREAISSNTKYSSQLNSFETHLKAAAFALNELSQKPYSQSLFKVIAVGADWTTNDNILGYQDALQPDIYRKPVSGALDLIIQAKNNPSFPHFLILDEMNLSHVERYFADILSAIESEQEIALHTSQIDLRSNENETHLVPSRISLPKNLFIIGTVNVDETTYMFSPKVLDRANVIEFRSTAKDIEDFLKNPSKIDMDSLAGKGACFGQAFVKQAATEPQLDAETAAELKTRLAEVFNALTPIGAEFGFRTAYEITRFIHFHSQLAGEGWKFNDALDAQVLQKLMPKLHGSQRRLEPILKILETFCTDHNCTASLEKINRMQDRLKDGFTSFAEA